MDNRFYIFVLFVIQLVFIYSISVNMISYFNLYRRKKNPDWPLSTEEMAEYVDKGESHKFYLSPEFYIKIIFFERHKDRELQAAAIKTRLLILAYVGWMILVFLFILIFFKLA